MKDLDIIRTYLKAEMLRYLRCDRSGATLLPEQIHDVCGELVARVLILVQLLMVDLADLGQLGAVVRVLDRVICFRHLVLRLRPYRPTDN